MFKVEDDKNNTISFDLYPNATISWINGKAPVDAPECGFENEKCPVEVKKKLCKLQLLCREVKRIDGFTINKTVYFYHINYGVIQGFSASSEKSRNYTLEKMRYFFTCVWYRQSAADTSPTTLSQVNERTAKPSPFSIQGRLSEFFQIMAAKKK